MNLHERIFELGDRAINIAVGPENGPPLIMFHGVTRNWHTFAPILPALISNFEVFVVDFPGHGKSDRSKHGYRVIDYVNFADDLLTKPPFSTKNGLHIYGHSLGSMVVGAVAGRLKDRVHSVVMEDPPFHAMGDQIAATPLLNYFRAVQPFAGNPEQQSLIDVAKRLADVEFSDVDNSKTFRLGDTRDAAALRFTASCLASLDARVYEPIVSSEWLDDFDWQAEMTGVTCPVLVLQADPRTGGMMTDEDAKIVADSQGDCSLVKFPEVGHLIHWQATETLLRSVQAFHSSILA
jgi:pimeloyl-ACP methyl ester carboxylesterase